MLTFLAGAIAGASSNIQLVFSTFSTIADQALFVGDLLDFFAVKPVVSSNPGAIKVPRPIRQGFEFRNVSFAYPNGREVLSGVSFRLSPGERIALVGENGQGKTTIVKLLTRLYDPTAGQVLLDGKDLRGYDLDDLWSEIGVIFQDFMRYDLTTSENISMVRIDERDNIFRIRAAAQKSLAEDVIRKLPKGYEQQLGRDSTAARIFRAASGKSSPWPALICAKRRCWYWTSRPRRWTPGPNTRSLNDLPNLLAGRWPC